MQSEGYLQDRPHAIAVIPSKYRGDLSFWHSSLFLNKYS
jgi:hypothetical protein